MVRLSVKPNQPERRLVAVLLSDCMVYSYRDGVLWVEHPFQRYKDHPSYTYSTLEEVLNMPKSGSTSTPIYEGDILEVQF